MITWIHGNSGAGKTRLAKALQDKYGGILLDGDSMRRCWPSLGFNKEDRKLNNIRIAKIAKMIDLQGIDVIVATICPYKELREEVWKITNCKFIECKGGKVHEEYPYES